MESDAEVLNPPRVRERGNPPRFTPERELCSVRCEVQHQSVDIGRIRRNPQIRPYGARWVALMAKSLAQTNTRFPHQLANVVRKINLQSQGQHIGEEAG